MNVDANHYDANIIVCTRERNTYLLFLYVAQGVKQNPRGSAKGMYALGALLRNHEAAQARNREEIGPF